MNNLSICPQCSSELVSDYETGSRICGCGYTENQALTNVYEKRDRNMIKVYAITSALILVFYTHVMSWGSFAAQIPFLKASQMLGLASPKTYQTIVDACIQQNKWSCVQNTYLSWYKSTGDVETIASLGHFRTLLKDFPGAAKAYASYYTIGGKNPEVAIRYAQVLEKNNDLDGALKYLNLSIQQSGTEKLPAQATGEIVQILIKQQKLAEARETIANFWDSAENAKGYFNTEYDAITKVLGPMKAKSSRVAKR